MKFRSTSREKRKIKANVDLTPLIDVVFLLIIFFMLSATFVVQNSIQIEMPEAKGTAELEQKDVSVTLAAGDGGPDGSGMVYIDNEPVPTWDELGDRLAAARRDSGPEFKLIFRVDGRVPTGQTVKVMGIARSVGIERFAFAAKPAEE
jgi:biopolymer transport protein ExbD